MRIQDAEKTHTYSVIHLFIRTGMYFEKTDFMVVKILYYI